jgi:dihydrofolate reductase
MILSLLVAADEGGVIGKDNALPWHFKNLTWAMPILMGRKTYESIGKPLPGRKSIVITRNKDWQHEGISVVHSIEEAINLAKDDGVKEIFVIGGAEIFATSLPIANRVYLTRIHHHFEGDVYFPALDTTWKKIKAHDCAPDEKNAYPHTFEVWERKVNAGF